MSRLVGLDFKNVVMTLQIETKYDPEANVCLTTPMNNKHVGLLDFEGDEYRCETSNSKQARTHQSRLTSLIMFLLFYTPPPPMYLIINCNILTSKSFTNFIITPCQKNKKSTVLRRLANRGIGK